MDKFRTTSSGESLNDRITRRIRELDERIDSVEKRNIKHSKKTEEPINKRIVVRTNINSPVVLESLDQNKVRNIIRKRESPSKVKVNKDEKNGYIIYEFI